MSEVAVATTSPLAAEAALAVIEDGGNAVDAAVAASMASTNTQPGVCALAGGGYAVGDWGAGWVMFEKRGTTAAGFYENGVDFILQRQQPVGTGSWRLVMASNLVGTAVAYDRFGTAASSVGTFSIDYRDPSSGTLTGAARCVVVAAVTGRITTNRPTAGAC